MENVRNCLKLELFEEDDNKNTIKQQSKLTFKGIHKSNENCDSYTLKQKDIYMEKPIHVGFAVLELSKLHM